MRGIDECEAKLLRIKVEVSCSLSCNSNGGSFADEVSATED